jgi:hypothetical protein
MARAGISARIALLDKQIVDSDQLPIGRVDDAEIELPNDGGPPRVAALLVGAEALGDRLGGATGRVMAATAARLRHGTDGPPTIDAALIADLEPMIKLRVRFAALEGVAGLERWLSERVERAPGAGDAPE